MHIPLSARESDMSVKERGVRDACHHSLLMYESYKKSTEPVWSLYLANSKFVLNG